jgi:hypothetical protein
MNKIFNGVAVTGIINPGSVYIFEECRSREYDCVPLDCLYCIRHEEEILPALDMKLCIIDGDECDLIKFFGIRRLNKNCHEFKVLMYDSDLGKKVSRSFYLQRVQTFGEYLIKMKKLYDYQETKPLVKSDH